MTKTDSNDKAAAALRNSLVYFAVAEEASISNQKLHEEVLKLSSDLFQLLTNLEKGEFDG